MDNQFLPRFFKGIVSTGMGSLCTLVFGFVTITLAVRIVSKEQFGTFLLLQVIVYSLVMISDLGINLAVTRAIASAAEGEQGRIISASVTLKLLTIALATTLIMGCGGYLFAVARIGTMEKLMVPLNLLFVLESLFAFDCAVLQGLQRYRVLALSQVILSVLNLLLTALLLMQFREGLFALIYARQLSLALAVFYQLKAMPDGIRLFLNRKTVQDVLTFGLPLGLNNIMTFIFMRIDTLIIGSLLNPVGVAYYGTAGKIPDAGRQMFESFRSVYFPHVVELFARKRQDVAVQVLETTLRSVTFVAACCLIIVSLFNEEIVTLLFTKNYLACAPIMELLMVAMTLSLIGYTLGTSLVAAGYSKLPMLINTVDTAVALVANIIMIPRYGITGAACAAILARAVSVPVNLFFLRKYGIRVRSAPFIKPLVIAGCCYGASLILPVTLAVNLFLLAVFILMSLGFSVITRGDLSLFVKGLKMQPVPSAR